jgi:transposase-like protein
LLVTSDAHPGLVAAIAAPLPGASWQRCCTHYMPTLLTKVPREICRQVWSSNSQERLNKEQRRRTDVAGIFPGLPSSASSAWS